MSEQDIIDVALRTVDVTQPTKVDQQARDVCNMIAKGWEIVSTASMPGVIYYVLVLKEESE